MFFTTKGRYGLMAMYELAKLEGLGPVPLSELSKRVSVSLGYLEQIFLVLRKEGLIKSVRGAKGGYVLAKDPSEISVGDILKKLEGPLVAAECVMMGEEQAHTCNSYDSCATRVVLTKVTQAVDRVIESTSLQDMLVDAYFVEGIQTINKNWGFNLGMRKVYFDYSATTPVKDEVSEYLKKFLSDVFGNASSVHDFGVQSKNYILEARKTIANCLNCMPKEIYFTSGGTESDNWALRGVAEALKNKGKHIITTSIEHPAILRTAEYLETQAYDITYLGVDEYGLVNSDDLRNAIREDTILVSVIFVNNEIGTIQDIRNLGNICRERGVLFHTDAVQAFSNVKIDLKDMPIDMMSLSAHKFYSIKGTGALFVKNGIKIESLIKGGAQENNKRAGTENLTGIMAMAKAAEIAYDNMDEHIEYLTELREYTLNRVLNEIDGVKYNGHSVYRHPANLNFSFQNLNSTAILIGLDKRGIAVSAGSACSSGSIKASHVLKAIGLDDSFALGSIRISMGDFTKKSDCDYLVESLKGVISNLQNK